MTDNNMSELHRNFGAFVQSADERIGQLERKGSDTEYKKINERLDQMEAASNRSARGVDVKKDDEAAAAAFAAERKSHYHGELDAKAYRQYKSAFGNYLRKNNAGGGIEEVKALSVGSDPDGGFAVHPDMNGRIASLVYETSPMRQISNVVTIGTDALEGINDLSEATSGWVGETDARTETGTPQLGAWRIPVHEQYAEPRATQKLLDDAMFDVEGYLAGKIADRLARMENAAFINGDGIQKPRGILTYPEGTPSAGTFGVIERINSGDADGFPTDDAGDVLIDLVHSLKSVYREKACFLMNRSTLAEVRKLKDGNGNYLWQPDFQLKQGGTLLGFNVVEAEDMPDIGEETLPIAFGDFSSAYQIVDRQGVRILRDSYTSKPYVKFYTTKRVGGDVVNFEAVKLLRIASNA